MRIRCRGVRGDYPTRGVARPSGTPAPHRKMLVRSKLAWLPLAVAAALVAFALL
jgi:hypothetical protein